MIDESAVSPVTSLFPKQCLPVESDSKGCVAAGTVGHCVEFLPISRGSKESADGAGPQVEKILRRPHFQVITTAYQRHRRDTSKGRAGEVHLLAVATPHGCDTPSAGDLPFSLPHTDVVGRVERHDIYILLRA